jgi:excisionase family DNA binding protein
MKEFYTVAEAAVLFSVSQRTVKNQIVSGKIYGFKIGAQWRIPSAEIDRLKIPVKRAPVVNDHPQLPGMED